MTKPVLGTKRLCAGCNSKFYDLAKTPIVCPMCEAVFVIPKPAPARSPRASEQRVAAVTITAPATAPAVELVSEGDNAEGDKEADAGVPLLEEMDED